MNFHDFFMKSWWNFMIFHNFQTKFYWSTRIQALLGSLRWSFLLSIGLHLLRIIMVPSLLLVVVVLVLLLTWSWCTVIAISMHFSVFRVALFQQRSFTVFLLILNIRNTMSLLWWATWHIPTELFLMYCKNFNIIIHLHRSLLLHLIIVVLIIIDWVSLTSIC